VTGLRSAIRNEMSDSCRMSFSVSLAMGLIEHKQETRPG
jgi:hypothetical protein